ncbi:SEC-C domain-containing protein [Bacillaceae bacterium S4-13-56]
MSKIRRNDPCPCGSGKKHKKCCGAQSKNDVREKLINEDLDRLEKGLISFAVHTYGEEVNKEADGYQEIHLSNNTDTSEVYKTGLAIWIIFHKILSNLSQTIFHTFFNKYQSKLSAPTRNVFSQWETTVPSVYKVLDIDRNTKKMISVEDILTKKNYQIPFQDGDEYTVGSLVIGALVLYADHHKFIYTVIKLYRHDESSVVRLLEKYSKKDDGIAAHYPALLAEILLLGVDEDEWKNPLYEEVAQLVANNMSAKDYEDKVIIKAITLWRKFCHKTNPSFKKPSAYAAALEYFVHKIILKEESITQNQIALEYEASPVTVSNNYRKLLTFDAS